MPSIQERRRLTLDELWAKVRQRGGGPSTPAAEILRAERDSR